MPSFGTRKRLRISMIAPDPAKTQDRCTIFQNNNKFFEGLDNKRFRSQYQPLINL
jgi:hypothetical protein